MKHIRFNVLVALVLVSKYVLKKVDGYDGDFSVNVAYGKPANQSSAYRGDTFYGEPNGFPYIASLAVDGIKTTNFLGNSCSHTALGQSSSWWEVNLQGLYDVSSIKIYQRDDAYKNSLEGFVVDGMQSDANYITIDQSGPYSTGVITISLQPKRQLKSIRIRLLKDNAFICLCEVEVFADIDECRTGDSVCHNHGQCTNTDGGFTCQCRTGYTGLTCETDIDECKSRASVCHNQGRCTNTVGNFTCQCTNGYTGRRCETDIDECKTRESVCHNQGRCTNTVGNFRCQCTNGYTGHRCETDIDECKTRDSVCHNQGRCTNTVGNFTCQCTNGYTGRRCETDIDECETRDSVCHNQGRCTNTVGNFTCQCTNGYTGRRCETDIDECSSRASACLNQGRCTNTIGNFTCQCTNGYTGITCETDIDECRRDVSVCHNQGRCINTVGNCTCQCTNGFTGLTCETDIDECSSRVSACLNQGRCTNTIGNFTCQCTNGYTGLTCETDIDDCTQEGICHYHGQCSNTDGIFACKCSAGYKGITCENVTRCTEIVPPEYGVIVVEPGTEGRWSFNTTVAIICNTGYSLNGETLIKCLETGRWTSALGYCLALQIMNADGDESKTSLLAWVIAGPLCILLLVTNIATCLRLLRHTNFKRKKRNNVPGNITTEHNVNASDLRHQAKEGNSAYDFVEDTNMETFKNVSNESENNAMEPYVNLQMDTRAKSEYDQLTFEREST